MARASRPLGLFLTFLLLLAAALVARPVSPRPVYDPAGNGPDGLLLLGEWLAEMGYQVGTTGEKSFVIDRADLLFIYPGVEPFTRGERERLVEWVEEGGTLALVAADDRELSAAFDFSLARGSAREGLVQSQPLLPEAGAVITGTNFASRLRLPGDSPAVALLADESAAAHTGAAVLRRGEGWVWLLAEDFTLTNERLTTSRASGQIVPALLRAVPEGGEVLFDTHHLFGRAEVGSGIGSLQEWAYTTPTGWAALFLLGLAFVYLLLAGRRLGPPLQTIAQGRRREAAEFVVAMAGLQRRAGVRDSIGRQQSHRLKQRLGRPWQLPADLPDGEFVTRLAALDTACDDTRLRRLLIGLANAPDEAALVRLVQEAEALASTKR